MGNIKNFNEFNSLNESKKKCKDEECETKKDSSKSDEEKYLSAKQRKLPEGLKKGIIARVKKSGSKPKDEVEEKETKEKEEPKKSDISKSDEEKYLSVKQRKLPEGLKKGIIARAKKSKKVTESLSSDVELEDKIIDCYDDCDSCDLNEFISNCLETLTGYDENLIIDIANKVYDERN